MHAQVNQAQAGFQSHLETLKGDGCGDIVAPKYRHGGDVYARWAGESRHCASRGILLRQKVLLSRDAPLSGWRPANVSVETQIRAPPRTSNSEHSKVSGRGPPQSSPIKYNSPRCQVRKHFNRKRKRLRLSIISQCNFV